MLKFLDRLKKLNKNEVYPFHMPGHKRNTKFFNFPNPAEIDITEIDGYDNLHNANGMILQLEKMMASKSKSISSLISVNGSTGAILSGISSCLCKGDKIIVSRNCHKSVFNACFLNELETVWLEPNYNDLGFYTDINLDAVVNIIKENPDAKMLVITSPTYEGVVSDIKSIADICHKNNILLFVDEAHGAHFSFSNIFPKSATELGADLVCESYHKTLPSLTQCAVLHICSKRIDENKVKKYMSIFQTSSPSYVLMASEEVPFELTYDDFENYNSLLDNFYINTKLNHLSFYKGDNVFDFDKSKIVVLTNKSNITGVELGNILLHKYGIQLEMCSINYAIAMTSVCDTENGFDRLSKALKEIDSSLVNEKRISISKPSQIISAKKISDITNCKKENLQNAVGKLSGEYVFAYPPGIPILIPGQVIEKDTIDYINLCMKLKVNIISESGDLPSTLNIDNI